LRLNREFMRRRRKRLRLTQAQAAHLAGLANAQKWSNYENGQITDPQISTLEGIARALKCKPADLLTSEADGDAHHRIGGAVRLRAIRRHLPAVPAIR
jgi:transcriptional regulator with XRE-family HTH domain